MYPAILQVEDVSQYLFNTPTINITGPSRQPRLIGLQVNGQYARCINVTGSASIVLDISTVLQPTGDLPGQLLYVLASMGNGSVAISISAPNSDRKDFIDKTVYILKAGNAVSVAWDGSRFVAN